jgi:hypothetical protein
MLTKNGIERPLERLQKAHKKTTAERVARLFRLKNLYDFLFIWINSSVAAFADGYLLNVSFTFKGIKGVVCTIVYPAASADHSGM